MCMLCPPNVDFVYGVLDDRLGGSRSINASNPEISAGQGRAGVAPGRRSYQISLADKALRL